jgi:hypothetical protein
MNELANFPPESKTFRLALTAIGQGLPVMLADIGVGDVAASAEATQIKIRQPTCARRRGNDPIGRKTDAADTKRYRG